MLALLLLWGISLLAIETLVIEPILGRVPAPSPSVYIALVFWVVLTLVWTWGYGLRRVRKVKGASGPGTTRP